MTPINWPQAGVGAIIGGLISQLCRILVDWRRRRRVQANAKKFVGEWAAYNFSQTDGRQLVPMPNAGITRIEQPKDWRASQPYRLSVTGSDTTPSGTRSHSGFLTLDQYVPERAVRTVTYHEANSVEPVTYGVEIENQDRLILTPPARSGYQRHVLCRQQQQ